MQQWGGGLAGHVKDLLDNHGGDTDREEEMVDDGLFAMFVLISDTLAHFLLAFLGGYIDTAGYLGLVGLLTGSICA